MAVFILILSIALIELVQCFSTLTRRTFAPEIN